MKYDSIGLPNHLLKMEMDLEMFDLYKRNTGIVNIINGSYDESSLIV
ncbi:MAG: hypothetical protein IPG85_14045 [Bacteroidetes bacterium]|nr:hypothetical protein [Bacteroidota bacterium]